MQLLLTPAASTWTRAEQKSFEIALAVYWNDADRWDKVATLVPGREKAELLNQYQVLQEDIQKIYDAACLPDAGPCDKRLKEAASQRKGVPWSEDEHRQFLHGLSKFGKGSWRSISRQFVITRTPTQVASHAQKYFLRLNMIEHKKINRRASIHDMPIG